MDQDVGTLPERLEVKRFVPVAYYDKHMDCIRVVTHDRSVTEVRLDGFLTLHECNRPGAHDPQYVGFTIKGIHHLFETVGLSLDRVYRLADLIDQLVKYRPGSTMSAMLGLVYEKHNTMGDLSIDMRQAA